MVATLKVQLYHDPLYGGSKAIPDSAVMLVVKIFYNLTKRCIYVNLYIIREINAYLRNYLIKNIYYKYS